MILLKLFIATGKDRNNKFNSVLSGLRIQWLAVPTNPKIYGQLKIQRSKEVDFDKKKRQTKLH